MKIKCPLIVSNGDGGCRRHGCGYRCDRFFMLDVEISTPALIEELGNRRPCEKCAYQHKNSFKCYECIWPTISHIAGKDNFKEANHGKV